MAHASPFIATIVISLVVAYAGGLAARFVGLPNIVGYLLAGIVVGPHTPGFIADPKLTTELAEIGVALLMFTIGLHFSWRDLTIVWHIAVPGALVQIAGCAGIGYSIGRLLGWEPGAALILGLAIAISSTAVATKALEERRQLATEAGRITLGWLVVQDIVVIVALVLLPLVAREAPNLSTLALLTGETMLMIALFVGLLLGVGRWLLPAILGWTARFGSQELFTLGVIVMALGIAYGSAMLLGLSVALGAFFAGMVLGESDMSYQAAAESLPIQSIFTVLFFVSVGTLFNPMLFITAPFQIVSLVIAIIAGCGIIFFSLLIILGVRGTVAGLVAGTLAQVGEFSFILTSLAAGLGLMTGTQQGLVLAAALSSILLHSLTIRGYGALARRLDGRLDLPLGARRMRNPHSDARALAGLRDHVIIVGHGRVGSVIARALKIAGQSFVVIDGQWRVSEFARGAGTTVIFGDATREEVFKVARPRNARLIVVALPDAFRTRRVIELARQANPQIGIVARAHSDDDYQYLTELRVGLVIMGEREIALSMSDYTLRQMGLDAASAQDVVDGLRKGIVAKGKSASPSAASAA